MAAAQSLVLQQQQIHKCKTHLLRHPYSPPRFPFDHSFSSSSVNCEKIRTKSFQNLSVICSLLNNNNSSCFNSISNGGSVHTKIEKIDFAKFATKTNLLENFVKPFQKPVLAVLLLWILHRLYPSYFVFTWALLIFAVLSYISESQTTVLKLQVGLSGMQTSLQKDLDQIAKTEDKSTREGLHDILTDTVRPLLRYPDHCISAYSSFNVKRNMEEGEKGFYQHSFEEHCKLDAETLINVNNIEKQSSTALRSSRFGSEHMVVTILVAARRKLKLPCIKNSKDLKRALMELGGLALSRTVAVEVLWTPRKEDNILSEKELLEKYPLLRRLQKV